MREILQINTDWDKTIFKDFGVTRFSTPFCDFHFTWFSHKQDKMVSRIHKIAKDRMPLSLIYIYIYILYIIMGPTHGFCVKYMQLTIRTPKENINSLSKTF